MSGMYFGMDSTAENRTCATTYTRGHFLNAIAGLDLSTKVLYTKPYTDVKGHLYTVLYISWLREGVRSQTTKVAREEISGLFLAS